MPQPQPPPLLVTHQDAPPSACPARWAPQPVATGALHGRMPALQLRQLALLLALLLDLQLLLLLLTSWHPLLQLPAALEEHC